MSDIVYRMALDDQQFRQKLAGAESTVSRRMGRIGSVIESKTAGVRKLSGALSGVVGAGTALLGVVSGVAAIAAAAGTVVGIMAMMATSAERAAAALNEQVEAAQKLRLEFRDGVGIGGPEGFGGRRQARGFENRRAEIMAAFERADADLLKLRLPASEYFDRRDQLERDAVDALFQAQLAAQSDAHNALRQTEAKTAALRGDDRQAALIGEDLNHQANVAAIHDRGLRDHQLAARLLDAENERHAQAIENINTEADARAQAQQQAATAAGIAAGQAQHQADLAALQIEHQNKLIALEQDLQAAKLGGDTQRAEALQLEIEHRQRILDLSTRQGLDDSRRATLIARQNDLYNQQLAQIGDSAATAIAPPRVTSVPLGLANSTEIAGRILGGPRDAERAAAQERRRQTSLQTRMARSLESIERKGGTSGSAVFG